MSAQPHSPQRSHVAELWPFYLVAALMSALLLAYLWIFRAGLPNDVAGFGQFGDYMGGIVNPFVGLVTVFLLIRTVRLQQDELAETRAEMALQRGELAEQHRQAKLQNEILSLQSFEQSFFAWLSAHSDLVRDLRLKAGSETINGQQVLEHFVIHTCDAWKWNADSRLFELFRNGYTVVLEEEELQRLASRVCLHWQHVTKSSGLSAVLRNMYGLLSWVDMSPLLSETMRSHYVGIITARLSDAELRSLLLNAMADDSGAIGELLYKYDMLMGLPVNEIPATDYIFEAFIYRFTEKKEDE